MKNSYSRKPFDLWTRNESNAFTRRLAFFCAQRSGRFSETLCNFVSDDRTDLLSNFNIDYHVDDSTRELAFARQTLAFYSKDADLAGPEAETAFWKSFIETERQCRTTNARISKLFQSGELLFCADGIFYSVMQKITEIIQDAPLLEDLDISFGPGVSVGLKNNDECSPRFKMDCTPTCSESLSSSVKAAVSQTVPHWMAAHEQCLVVRGRLGSVPKNAKTRRSIIVEPILNGAIQKGIGTVMKTRLLAFGCNLYSQVKNQKLALRASLLDDLATLDLSNASNTVSLLLVFHLMSETWFNILDQVRTSQIEYKGNNIDLEMFSSMGNGFTFELESLIFYAIALCVAERVGRESGSPIDLSQISVYGDDIIVPRIMEKEMQMVLELFGFTLNREKSYVSGPFRESCGVDYFLGTNIRPFYKKDRWTNARVVGLLNYDLAHCDLFAEIREELIVFSTRCGFPSGPSGYGDGHLHVREYDPDPPPYKSLCEQTPKQRFKHGTKDGYTFKTIVKIPKVSETTAKKGDTLIPLYTVSQRPRLYEIKRRRTLLVYDVYGIARYVKFDVIVGYSAISSQPEKVDEDLARESDPYVIRGGYKTKTVDVYMFHGT